MRSKLLKLAIVAILFSTYTTRADEGMYPLSELKKLNLARLGFQLTPEQIFNPKGTSLVNALVNISGCSGSFVSDKGLIITNHHCAFSAVQLASTPEQDYLTNGFMAPTMEKEIEAKGLVVRITDSYEDVSARILDVVKSIADPAERLKAIQEKIKAIVAEEEAKDNTIKAEVSEMFIGRTYVLFRYKTIQDVRLVYIPMRAIGEFGGETDNWVWPRHTGDFSFVRAYVAPDGKSAPYSKDNVPYTPKTFLKINANGASEKDFVFIMGYPGRTFRHRPSQYLQYQKEYLLPYVSELFSWQNKQMEETGSADKALELKQASRIKRNANVLKNYQGKLKGLNSIDLVQQKRQEERKLAEYIDSKPELKARYGSLLPEVDKVYSETMTSAKQELWFGNLYSSVNALSAANQINKLKKQLVQSQSRQETMKTELPKVKKAVTAAYIAYVPETDRRLMGRMLKDALMLPENQRVELVDQMLKNNGEASIKPFVEELYKKSVFTDPEKINQLLERNDLDTYLMSFEDPMLDLVTELTKQTEVVEKRRQRWDGELNRLLADYVEVKSMWKKTDFVPDANSTLRLTYGKVKGYRPYDAMYHQPVSHLTGILEKESTGNEDFEIPEKLKTILEQFPGKEKVPVAILYNLDTTGGNSGSPIMNSKGELVGVNFDRALTATINDFAWNESYSRSIGVSIKYVLWVAKNVDKADFILKELKVQ